MTTEVIGIGESKTAELIGIGESKRIAKEKEDAEKIRQKEERKKRRLLALLVCAVIVALALAAVLLLGGSAAREQGTATGEWGTAAGEQGTVGISPPTQSQPTSSIQPLDEKKRSEGLRQKQPASAGSACYYVLCDESQSPPTHGANWCSQNKTQVFDFFLANATPGSKFSFYLPRSIQDDQVERAHPVAVPANRALSSKEKARLSYRIKNWTVRKTASNINETMAEILADGDNCPGPVHIILTGDGEHKEREGEMTTPNPLDDLSANQKRRLFFHVAGNDVSWSRWNRRLARKPGLIVDRIQSL